MKNFKPCARCGKRYYRAKNLSATQWEKRRFCSRRCGALRHAIPSAELKALYKKGRSSKEIGDLYGISDTHVRRLLVAAGVRIRSAGEAQRLSHSRPALRKKMSAARKGIALPESAKRKLRKLIGPKNANWISGLTIGPGGYLMFSNSKANGAQRGRYLHTIIAEWKLKRSLNEGEVVHHIDHNKLNNHPDNLQVMSHADHARHHALESKLGVKKCQAA